MRYQVPQFVDIEDKIVGPFTLKQFLIYVGAVMCLVPVFLLSDLSLFIAIALPVLGIAAAFAHVRIANKSLFMTIYNAVIFIISGQVFIWRRTKGASLAVKDPIWKNTMEEASDEGENTSLSRIARNLETNGNVVKTEEVEDLLDTTKQE